MGLGNRTTQTLKQAILGPQGFGARLIKTAVAVTLAVTLAAALFGMSGVVVFAGISAFAAVAPSLHQAGSHTMKTIFANLLGGLWAAAVLLIPGDYPLRVTLAVFGGLFLSHRLLPEFEGASLAAILVLIAQTGGDQTIVLGQRLGIVLLGSAIGLLVNAVYPPRHLDAARHSLEEAYPELDRFARWILESLSNPATLSKETIKQEAEKVQRRLDEAVRRLSFVGQELPERKRLRRDIQTLAIALESFTELHRLSLYAGGYEAEKRQRVGLVVDAVLAALDALIGGGCAGTPSGAPATTAADAPSGAPATTAADAPSDAPTHVSPAAPADMPPGAPPDAWRVLADIDVDPFVEPHLYPLYHLAVRLRQREEGTEGGKSGWPGPA